MTQFMKPHLFEEAQREAVMRILTQLGIGDEEGRRIFVYALEYEVAQLEAQQAEERTSAPLPTEPGKDAFSRIGEAADTLNKRLERLSQEERQHLGEALTREDPYARAHGDDYFAALGAELRQLVTSSGRVAPPAPPVRSTSSAKRRFVSMLAKAYKDCFEEAPSAASDSPFYRLLQSLAQELDIDADVSPEELFDLFYKSEWDSLTLSRR